MQSSFFSAPGGHKMTFSGGQYSSPGLDFFNPLAFSSGHTISSSSRRKYQNRNFLPRRTVFWAWTGATKGLESCKWTAFAISALIPGTSVLARHAASSTKRGSATPVAFFLWCQRLLEINFAITCVNAFEEFNISQHHTLTILWLWGRLTESASAHCCCQQRCSFQERRVHLVWMLWYFFERIKASESMTKQTNPQMCLTLTIQRLIGRPGHGGLYLWPGRAPPRLRPSGDHGWSHSYHDESSPLSWFTLASIGRMSVLPDRLQLFWSHLEPGREL